MRKPSHRHSGFTALCPAALSGFAAILCLALLPGMVPSACAQTTISGSQTVTGNPLANFWNSAGTVTLQNGATLFQNQVGSQSAAPTSYNITNALVFAGSLALFLHL